MARLDNREIILDLVEKAEDGVDDDDDMMFWPYGYEKLLCSLSKGGGIIASDGSEGGGGGEKTCRDGTAADEAC